jgi:cystathionine beta-synthase
MSKAPVYDSILDAVGNTPLVRLNKITASLKPTVYAKLEFLNPMGSIKDRIARHMIAKAEAEGRIHKGQLIIENSSGNTAMGLALVAIQKGYRLKVVVRDSLTREKMNQLKALGVDIQTVDSTLPPDHPDSYNQITPRLAAETPGCYFPDQHRNRENNQSHYLSTGPEIWEQMAGKIDVIVAGMGTGGTIGGTAQYLKEQDPKIRVVAVDPIGSIFYDYFYQHPHPQSAPYYIEGLGDEFPIETADFSVIDEIVRVSDRDAFHMTRRLVREEAVMAGGSSGAALCGVFQVAADMPQGSRIVTIFPDSASRYLSTLFNDEWMKARNLL